MEMIELDREILVQVREQWKINEKIKNKYWWLQVGMTVLLSEQNSKFAIKHADRAYIVDNGAIKYQGSISELEQNEEIKKRYFAV